ncbi:hypothetical protein BGZ63DRAFT_229512 [Mariannaea sp. PMI_226]|nr:hypothetical protein BGZ63DRAFT_229512 [Mariannaea sp. PMI_226]
MQPIRPPPSTSLQPPTSNTVGSIILLSPFIASGHTVQSKYILFIFFLYDSRYGNNSVYHSVSLACAVVDLWLLSTYREHPEDTYLAHPRQDCRFEVPYPLQAEPQVVIVLHIASPDSGLSSKRDNWILLWALILRALCIRFHPSVGLSASQSSRQAINNQS